MQRDTLMRIRPTLAEQPAGGDSTILAGLELARDETITTEQREEFGAARLADAFASEDTCLLNNWLNDAARAMKRSASSQRDGFKARERLHFALHLGRSDTRGSVLIADMLTHQCCTLEYLMERLLRDT